jgi:hypothetical protein
MHDCEMCHEHLKSWSFAVQGYARSVGHLIRAAGHNHSELYDKSTEALELATAAKLLFDLHREAHVLKKYLTMA